MRQCVVLCVAVLLIGAAGCGGGSSTGGVGGRGGAGAGGSAGAHGSGGASAGGSTGSGGAAGAGTGGVSDAGTDVPAAVGGMTGSGGSSGSSGSGGSGSGGSIVDAGLIPASCPATINGVLKTTDSVQTGRESRIPSPTICGPAKVFPSNAADPSNPHFYNAYHFVNPSGASACFTFTLTYDSGSVDGSAGVQRYLTAYSAYDPLNIGNNYLGDVGDVVTSPQTMSITVPAGSSIDVVVFAIPIAPNGAGSYTLSCDTGSSGAGGADGGAGGAAGSDGGATDGGGGVGGNDAGGGDASDGAADAPPDVASDT